MKTVSWLTLSLILFLAVGCSGFQQEATKNNTASPVESSNVETDSKTAEKDNSTKEVKDTKEGSFVSGEHPTEGNVRILTEQGQKFIELDANFKTSDLGPDLVVILHRSPDVIGSTKPPAFPIKEGDYVVIAPLSQYNGTQRYSIPDNINLADYQSVAIWCRKFNATFGAAVLQ